MAMHALWMLPFFLFLFLPKKREEFNVIAILMGDDIERECKLVFLFSVFYVYSIDRYLAMSSCYHSFLFLPISLQNWVVGTHTFR
jgi:hypothetical protein